MQSVRVDAAADRDVLHVLVVGRREAAVVVAVVADDAAGETAALSLLSRPLPFRSMAQPASDSASSTVVVERIIGEPPSGSTMNVGGRGTVPRAGTRRRRCRWSPQVRGCRASMATKASETIVRRLPVGAETFATGTHFRVWAPDRSRVTVVLEDRETELEREPDGYFAGLVPGAARQPLPLPPRRRRDAVPDPASRFQPDGPHGPSEVVDPGAFAWTDAGWPGVPPRARCSTRCTSAPSRREGTWAAARRSCRDLAELGVTVHRGHAGRRFPGRFGWGYDGVDLFAPTRLYGTPDDLRAFVDRGARPRHRRDPRRRLQPLRPRRQLPRRVLRRLLHRPLRERMGRARINFDGAERRAGARVLHRERRLLDRRVPPRRPAPRRDADDLRRLARRTSSPRSSRARARRPRRRPRHPRRRRERAAGRAAAARPAERRLSASTRCGTTTSTTPPRSRSPGRREAYYTDYRGSAAGVHLGRRKHGFLYQGQRYRWQKQARAARRRFGLPPAGFVTFLQNHDQVANSAPRPAAARS